MSCTAKNLNGAKRYNSLAKLFPSQLSPAKWKTNETAALVDLLHKVIPLSLREEKKHGKPPLKYPSVVMVFVHRAGLRNVSTLVNLGQFWTSELLKERQ